MSELKIQGLSHAFGGLQAITDFNLNLQSEQITGVIGPNGAGKTTLFNLICGIYPWRVGDITLDQQSLKDKPMDQVARLGIARTFQNIRLFKKLSVLDNVKIVIQQHYTLFNALLGGKKQRIQEQEITEQACGLLSRFGLSSYVEMRAGELPYGLQRRLEIVRALATNPKILLLDEPACGMNPHEAQQIAELIHEIRKERSLAILLIDHQMQFVMSLCHHIIVLNFGKTIAEGNGEMIRNHPLVIESYLGSK